MKKLVFHSRASYAPLVIRILLSLVLFPHGAQKMLGWFGGYGFGGTMAYFTGRGFPFFIGLLVIVIEFFGPLALLLGFATRIWSAAILALTTGIILTTHSNYFFMNWFGQQKAEGYEYFLLIIGMAVSLMVSGSGIWSIDRLWKYACREDYALNAQ